MTQLTTRLSESLPFRAAVWTIAAALIGLGALGFILRTRGTWAWPENLDFGIYLPAAEALMQGQNPYTIDVFEPYAYPPPFALILGVLQTAFGDEGARILWPVLSVASLLGAIILIFRGFGQPVAWRWAALFAGFAFISHATRGDLQHGQPNFQILLLLVAGLKLWLDRRWRWAAVLWGLMCTIKPFMGLIVFYLWRRKDPRAAIAVFIASGLIFAASFLPTFPHLVDSVLGWMESQRHYTTPDTLALARNQSFYANLIRIFTPPGGAHDPQYQSWFNIPWLARVLIWPIAALAVFAFLRAIPHAPVTQPPLKQGHEYALVEIGVLYALAFAVGPLLEGNYLFFLIPGLIGALIIAARKPKDALDRTPWIVAAVAWCVALVLLFTPTRPFINFVVEESFALLQGPGLLLAARFSVLIFVAALVSTTALRRTRALAA